jgi:hypothetical protein
MSDSPLLSKMDALLKKHRGGDNGHEASSDRTARAEHAVPPVHAAPPDAWLPVLTQVIERGTPPDIPAAAAAIEPEAVQPVSVAPPAPAAATPVDPALPGPTVSDTLAEQLMSELAPRLSEVMEKQVAAELRRNLDQTMASLLSQLDVNVREIVRDAVAEKLRHPRDPSA